jgi:colanic acid biosynthesis protein WcaH
MPIVCVDTIIISNKKILMIKRNKEPANGQFWFPGGRLLKDESLEDAAKRIVKLETNICLGSPIFIGHGETKFDSDPFGHGFGTHTINFVFATVDATVLNSIALDQHHSDAAFFSLDNIHNPSNGFHFYIKKYAKLAEELILEQ